MSAGFLECVIAGLGLLLLASALRHSAASLRPVPKRVSRKQPVDVAHLPPRREDRL